MGPFAIPSLPSLPSLNSLGTFPSLNNLSNLLDTTPSVFYPASASREPSRDRGRVRDQERERDARSRGSSDNQQHRRQVQGRTGQGSDRDTYRASGGSAYRLGSSSASASASTSGQGGQAWIPSHAHRINELGRRHSLSLPAPSTRSGMASMPAIQGGEGRSTPPPLLPPPRLLVPRSHALAHTNSNSHVRSLSRPTSPPTPSTTRSRPSHRRALSAIPSGSAATFTFTPPDPDPDRHSQMDSRPLDCRPLDSFTFPMAPQSSAAASSNSTSMRWGDMGRNPPASSSAVSLPTLSEGVVVDGDEVGSRMDTNGDACLACGTEGRDLSRCGLGSNECREGEMTVRPYRRTRRGSLSIGVPPIRHSGVTGSKEEGSGPRYDYDYNHGSNFNASPITRGISSRRPVSPLSMCSTLSSSIGSSIDTDDCSLLDLTSMSNSLSMAADAASGAGAIDVSAFRDGGLDTASSDHRRFSSASMNSVPPPQPMGMATSSTRPPASPRAWSTGDVVKGVRGGHRYRHSTSTSLCGAPLSPVKGKSGSGGIGLGKGRVGEASVSDVAVLATWSYPSSPSRTTYATSRRSRGKGDDQGTSSSPSLTSKGEGLVVMGPGSPSARLKERLNSLEAIDTSTGALSGVRNQSGTSLSILAPPAPKAFQSADTHRSHQPTILPYRPVARAASTKSNGHDRGQIYAHHRHTHSTPSLLLHPEYIRPVSHHISNNVRPSSSLRHGSDSESGEIDPRTTLKGNHLGRDDARVRSRALTSSASHRAIADSGGSVSRRRDSLGSSPSSIALDTPLSIPLETEGVIYTSPVSMDEPMADLHRIRSVEVKDMRVGKGKGKGKGWWWRRNSISGTIPAPPAQSRSSEQRGRDAKLETSLAGGSLGIDLIGAGNWTGTDPLRVDKERQEGDGRGLLRMRGDSPENESFIDYDDM